MNESAIDGGFPNVDNVDVWRYKNEFDYDRYTANVSVKMCNVPWCGDYDNVVYFDCIGKRDAYLNGIAGESVQLETMFNALPQGAIRVPVPATNAQLYNYLVIDLPIMTSIANPIEYAGAPRIGRYLYFITDAQQLSPSSTKLFITLDVWQTYIYGINFDYVMLARGHAPLAAVSAEDYLKDPVNNSTYLLAPDSNYGSARVPRGSGDVILNGGEQYAVFATAADLDLDWGSAEQPRVPAIAQPYTQSAPCEFCYGVDAKQLETFLKWIKANRPWFLDAVTGLFFVSKRLVTVASTRLLGGVEVHTLDAVEVKRDIIRLDMDAFGYPERARRYAKLYTYPYAQLVITNADGEATRIHIEDTRGYLELNACANITMPWVSVDVHLKGIGAEDARLMEFNTAAARYRTYQGAWYDTVKSYGIPVWSIAQSAYDVAGYRSAYSRAQDKYAADTTLASAVSSATTAEKNAGNSASNSITNNGVSTSANYANTTTANAYAMQGVAASNDYLDAQLVNDTNICSAQYQAEQAGLAVAATNNQARGEFGIVSDIASFTAGAMTGGAGLALSSLGSMGATGVNWAAANASITVSQSNSTSIYNNTVITNKAKNSVVKFYNERSNTIQNECRIEQTDIRNNAATAITANNAALIRTNAANTKTTAVANANRAHDVAIAGIQSKWNEAGVSAPVQQGARAGGNHAATRPLLVSAVVETQPNGAIMQAASDFARYGYALGQEWTINSLQVMKHFTYWQCAEVWCSGSGDILEGAQLGIKNIMINGVTVWSDPNKIGKVSVYDN